MIQRLSHFMHTTLIVVLAASLLLGSLATYVIYYYSAPGPLAAPVTVIFKRGTGFQGIIEELTNQQVIDTPLLFEAIVIAMGDAHKFKAGEYEFSASISPRLVIDMISEGKVVVHKITIPEGLRSRDVVNMLKSESALEGDVVEQIDDGTLLPETYHFVYGDSRQEIIDRMKAGMHSVVEELWAKRKADLPFDTPQQAVILASIVEKETGLASERGRVAAVFINRLKKGMKLQSDPTVAYGIAVQKDDVPKRSLTTSDLRKPTPYNTYTITGLPPGPIANPGRAAIEAVLNPPETNEFYFVATGTGGHNFSATMKGHEHNVVEYRKVKKAAKKAK